MTEPTSDPLAAFQRLLEGAATRRDVENPVVLTDALVGPELGAVLRRCAVPHEFDRRLLGRIGAWGAAEAEQRFREFSELSIMQFVGDALSVHERWRQPLWNWWLGEEQRAQFVTLNELLAEWFGASGSETDQRRQMFHLIGCRQSEGVRMFETLCRRARYRRTFSECSLLIRLVKEYEPVLSAGERAVIAYHDGKLASDLRDWERALGLFRSVATEPAAGTELQVNALVRQGHALRALGRTAEALAVLEDARRRSTGKAAADQAWRTLYELGEIYRDLGQADRADSTLRAALDQASKAEDRADMAGVLNSLGTVQLKLRDTDGAIDSFRKSIEQLKRRGDVLRPGAVLNNLGLAQIEKCDWDAAEASFAASLECKRAAGDQLGQANALLNLSRAQSAQHKLALAQASAAQAGTLYEAAGDGRGGARALLAQARLANRARQAEAARSLFQQAMERARAAGDAGIAGSARDELARVEDRGGVVRAWARWVLVLSVLIVLVLIVVAVIR
jgi:tetratricopeptide (TPR) repeat protein